MKVGSPRAGNSIQFLLEAEQMVWNGELCLWKSQFSERQGRGGKKNRFKEISLFLLICEFSGKAATSFLLWSCWIAQRMNGRSCCAKVTAPKYLSLQGRIPLGMVSVGFSPSHTNIYMGNACPRAILSSHYQTRDTDISDMWFLFSRVRYFSLVREIVP